MESDRFLKLGTRHANNVIASNFFPRQNEYNDQNQNVCSKHVLNTCFCGHLECFEVKANKAWGGYHPLFGVGSGVFGGATLKNIFRN